jgi:hypothetical protein
MFEFEKIAQMLIDEADGMDCAHWYLHRKMLKSRLKLMKAYANCDDYDAARAAKMLADYIRKADDWFER